jgi:glycosyltransferase involved in cell wall biosynthesis
LEKHLHIIAFTVPFPVDYGGVFDLFYKLAALQKQGVYIHLHCFLNNRSEQAELNKYCYSINYYERSIGHKGFSTSLPYIVSSRKNEELMQNLLKDDHPILMEGIHCTYLLNDERFSNRKKYVRLHNVEYQYYLHLSRSTNNFFRGLYYSWESKQLKKYENIIAKKATAFWAVTKKDVSIYKQEFNCPEIGYLPVYIPDEWEIKNSEGNGNYCLYHADLSVDSNERIAIWLLQTVFKFIQLPLVIAGKNPSKKLEHLAHVQQHTCLVANPGEKEMQDMIAKAHINILPSLSNTGIKLKLLNALYNGRFIIANENTTCNSDLEEFCMIAKNESDFKKMITDTFSISFPAESIQKRREKLTSMFNNERNAKQQVQWIWGDE